MIDAVFNSDASIRCSVKDCTRDTSRPLVRLPELLPEHRQDGSLGIVGIFLCEKHASEASDVCDDARTRRDEDENPRNDEGGGYSSAYSDGCTDEDMRRYQKMK